MNQGRKLQVFVSSTFTDLLDERQAAVQGILAAGHIPAGMELFTSGDQSQMEVIKRWIDQSDVYLLILGFRYGTVERLSGKSYTHLEYEYAIASGKPFFALVISQTCYEERFKLGSGYVEVVNKSGYDSFREIVENKIVSYWKDAKDLRIFISDKLAEFNNDASLKGWIRGDQSVDISLMAEEIARLSRENQVLRNAQGREPQVLFNGMPISEFENLLLQTEYERGELNSDIGKVVSEINSEYEFPDKSILGVLIAAHIVERDSGYFFIRTGSLTATLKYYDLAQPSTPSTSTHRFKLSQGAKAYIVKIGLKNNQFYRFEDDLRELAEDNRRNFAQLFLGE